MDEEGFTSYLKKKRKTARTIMSCVENARTFEKFLKNTGKSAADSEDADLDLFVSSVLRGGGVSKYMWTLQYYFSFIENRGLLKHAQRIREVYTSRKRKSFRLKDFRGARQDTIEKLAEIGIHSVDDMRERGKTKKQRKDISSKTGIKQKEILELAKLSDLTRLGAVKAVRARLYHDAGFDTIDKIARVTAEELIEGTKEFIERTGFEGIPPLPKEAENAVRAARNLSFELEL
jgi:hypothetical protein